MLHFAATSAAGSSLVESTGMRFQVHETALSFRYPPAIPAAQFGSVAFTRTSTACRARVPGSDLYEGARDQHRDLRRGIQKLRFFLPVMWPSSTTRSDFARSSARISRRRDHRQRVPFSSSGLGEVAQGIRHGADHRHAQLVDSEDDVRLSEQLPLAPTRLQVTMG